MPKGHSMGSHWRKETRGLQMMQTWLLVACVFLAVITEVQAINCNGCKLLHEKGLCEPGSKCNINKGACAVKTIYGKDGRATEKLKGCLEDQSKCGKEEKEPKTGFRSLFSCCSSKDYCSDNM